MLISGTIAKTSLKQMLFSEMVAKWQIQRNFETYLKVHCYAAIIKLWSI